MVIPKEPSQQEIEYYIGIFSNAIGLDIIDNEVKILKKIRSINEAISFFFYSRSERLIIIILDMIDQSSDDFIGLDTDDLIQAIQISGIRFANLLLDRINENPFNKSSLKLCVYLVSEIIAYSRYYRGQFPEVLEFEGFTERAFPIIAKILEILLGKSINIIIEAKDYMRSLEECLLSLEIKACDVLLLNNLSHILWCYVQVFMPQEETFRIVFDEYAEWDNMILSCWHCISLIEGKEFIHRLQETVNQYSGRSIIKDYVSSFIDNLSSPDNRNRPVCYWQ